MLFLISTPKYEGKSRTKGGFCAPKRECVPKQKSCPKRKQQDRCHWGAFSKKTFVLFFGLSPKCEGKICVKGGFCAPKAKIVPEKKAIGPTPRTCICDKYLFFGLHPRIYFFAPPKFSMPLSSQAHYSGTGSASMNRNQNKAEDCFFGKSQYHIYFNCLFRLGLRLFSFLFGNYRISKAVCLMISHWVDLAFYDLFPKFASKFCQKHQIFS